MECYSRKDESWLVKSAEEESTLELRLGPPGEERWIIKDKKDFSTEIKENENLKSFGYFSNNPCAKNPILKSPWQQQQQQHQPKPHHFLHLQNSEKKAATNTAVPNSQKRTAPAPVVGWPPIRSFRKNLASGSSSKLSSDAGPEKDSGPKPKEDSRKTLFVKINMDGIPIGRKVDLKAYDSYEKLSYAVDELFRGLLAAQSDSCAGGIKDKEEGGKAIGGLLDRNGEYTLVYEDNEGDRMLVGDVPWHMFVSTVKRLRVLKSSELPKLSRGGKQGKLSIGASPK